MKIEKRLTKFFDNAKVAAGDTGDAGLLYMEGYASVWDVTDLDGDIMRAGSFAKTISERVAAGKVLLMVRHFAHGGDSTEAVGLIIEAKEDSYGLWFKAELYDTDLARDTHAKVKRSPNAYGTSVGFKPIKYQPITDAKGGITGQEFLENALYEITVTACPCNTETSIEAKKDTNDFDKRLVALEAKVELLQQEKPASVATDNVGDNAESTPDNSHAESGYVSTKAKREREMAMLEVETN
jgi:HK97 family phage prohead protease